MKNEPVFPNITPDMHIDGRPSLRDYFAAAALTGMIANPDISETMGRIKLSPSHARVAYAESAYKQADEMLKARG